ncbi:DUF4276 family protein [Burkholderia vietnamiensis]|uniref:DUF4276 family protein n=1 Tax=Burkholderia vietnamiensis TaxID=60552 RepID=A0AAW7T7B5_BURVI|nr:DUF4276 family protein [Burkholderia vietnamiensis]MDN7798175.1 DUF4276 family protein [Burkholderia vietnamiensis]HDR9074699.1 DUF4276 family protein [Burkholderia vietnamiensis]HDR9190527.1 DUF4276 family protein [Burkholderia vietnamiensis]
MTVIGVIVEGDGEIDAISELLKKVNSEFEIRHNPIRADLQPKATSKVIARSARSQILLWKRRGVDLIVVLIDREDHECSCRFSSELEAAFHEMYENTGLVFRVVVKNRMIENWLVADVEALKQMRARFSISTKFERAVVGRADEVEKALDLLDDAANKGSYRKGSDPLAICKNQDVLRASKNSRSYRRFLRVLGCTHYMQQSKLPYDSPKLTRAAA